MVVKRSGLEIGQQGPVAIAAVILLVFSFFLGGASRQHELRLALIELASLPLLVMAGSALLNSKGAFARHRMALAVLGATALIPLVQLIPLPPTVWQHLPGRQPLSLALDLAGLSPGWSSLSLTPVKTWRSVLALTPPAAIFLGILTSSPRDRFRLLQLLLAGTVIAIMVGAAQFASGGRQFYPWRTTDAGNLAGFFANRNHLATFCLMSLPFAAVFGARAFRSNGSRGRLDLWLSGLLIAIVVVAIGVGRSRAGMVFIVPVLSVSLMAAWVAAGRGRPKPALLGLIGAAAVAGVALAVFALPQILSRFDAGGAQEGRFENWPVVAQAADTYLPVGSGIGSFDAVYRSVEPVERLDSTFFNQAHNEYLETWLEAGWPGVAALIFFLVWFCRRTVTAWRAGASTDRDLQRAASIAIGIVMVHSAVDYPARTETIAVLFALCCGLLELAARSDSGLKERN